VHLRPVVNRQPREEIVVYAGESNETLTEYGHGQIGCLVATNRAPLGEFAHVIGQLPGRAAMGRFPKFAFLEADFHKNMLHDKGVRSLE
jgi:hypothetical protein